MDSSNGELPQLHTVGTISRRVRCEMPAPLHSTSAQRERERKLVPGITVIEDEKEILQPKPLEKAEKKWNCFRGPTTGQGIDQLRREVNTTAKG
jgi:hypothetical protein